MIEVKNKELELFLQVILKKDIKRLEPKELDKIEDITLNAKDVQGNIISYDLDDLKLFRNLKTCTIRNYEITKKNVNALNNINNVNGINELRIHNCKFEENITLKLNVQTLQFISCKNLNVGDLISKSSINNLYILHCTDYNISNIDNNNVRNIYFDEVYISNEICENLLNSNIINIVFNNCDFINVSDKILSETKLNKNLVISNVNKTV